MGQENVDDFKLAAGGDLERVRERCEEQRTETLGATAETLAAQMPSLLTPTDAAAFTGELAEYLVSSEQDGFAPGAEGLLADSLALTRGWTFNVSDIDVPLLLMHGREDKFVPFGHGQWLAASITGVDARLLDHDGHLTLFQNRVGEVHAWLAAHA
jgi:pimeloyl-ACP methyl ester carboxylesterase